MRTSILPAALTPVGYWFCSVTQQKKQKKSDVAGPHYTGARIFRPCGWKQARPWTLWAPIIGQ